VSAAVVPAHALGGSAMLPQRVGSRKSRVDAHFVLTDLAPPSSSSLAAYSNHGTLHLLWSASTRRSGILGMPAVWRAGVHLRRRRVAETVV